MSQIKATIVGAKSTDWKSNDGRHYDHVTIFCLVPLDNSQGTAIGKGIIEFKWQDSKNMELLRKYQLPLDVTLEMDIVMGSKGTKQILNNVVLPAVK